MITPFNERCTGPNSYDVHIGDELKILKGSHGHLASPSIGVDNSLIHPDAPTLTPNVMLRSASEAARILGAYAPDDGKQWWPLRPGELYLATTKEVVGTKPDSGVVPMLHGRSSTGRLGISVHVTAGFGDVGFVGQWTLEITVVKPTLLRPGMRIAQFAFHELKGARCEGYAGRYQAQSGPTAGRGHESPGF